MKFRACLALLLLASCRIASDATTAAAEIAPAPNEYQPLREKDRWSYQFRSEFGGQLAQYRVKAVEVGRGENDAYAFVDEKGDYYLFRCDERELQLHGEREEGKIHTFSPPFVYLRRGMEKGRLYETENKSSQGEDLRCEARYLGRCEETTPAGSFPDCVRAEFRYHLPTGNSFWIETTLARGIGPVRKRFALEGKSGKVVAKFEQELLTHRMGGQTGPQTLDVDATSYAPSAARAQEASGNSLQLRLAAEGNFLKLRGFEDTGREIAFASPALLLLPEMKAGFPYRSSVKDAAGEKWEITTLLREPETENAPGAPLAVELRLLGEQKERSLALTFERGRGLASARTLVWDRKTLRPIALDSWGTRAEKTASEASSAFEQDALGRAMLRNAHESRAVWPADFHGYRASVRLEVEYRSGATRSRSGQVEISTKDKPSLQGIDGEDAAWLERELVSIVSHRRHDADSVGREPRGNFLVEEGDALGKIALRLSGDPMGSGWTIEDGRVTRVRRKEMGGTFEIEVLEIEKDASGRYVPGTYRVRHYGKDGAVTSWEDYRDAFEWRAGAPILQARAIEAFDATGGLTERKRIAFENIETLP